MTDCFVLTYAIDSLDPAPMVRVFDTESEAQDFLAEEMAARIEHIVSHSPYSLSEKDLAAIEEQESQLARIERLNPGQALKEKANC